MCYILTLIARRESTTLASAIIARVRDAIGRSEPAILSPGEAVDITFPAAPGVDAVRAAREGAAINAMAMPAEGRREHLLIAEMNPTFVTGETLDERVDFAGLKDRIAVITARAMNGEPDFRRADPRAPVFARVYRAEEIVAP